MTSFQPRDRTKLEHVARVEQTIFENADQSFVILALGDGLTAMGPAAASEFDPGLTYRFLGRWEDDPQRGYRFRFSTHVVHGVHSRAGVTKYLTDLCVGIGPKAAEKLWTAYGSDAVDRLRDEPDRVIAETGLNAEVVREASADLVADRGQQHTKIDLNGLFAGRGFQGKLIGECLKRWGAKAAETVRKNPYRLMNMTSAGFKRCDRLYLDLGLRPDALKRQVICTVQAIRDDRVGHTWLAADDLAGRLTSLIPNADPRRAFVGGLRVGLLSKRRDADGTLYLTAAGRAYAERLIADAAERLSKSSPLWPTADIPVSKADGDRLPSAHQVERLTLATAGAVGLFVGGPGTGKTHTLAYLLREIITRFGRSSVCLLAPTGKAAVRARQALKAAGVELPTSTIHSKLIECGRISLDGGDGEDMDGFGEEDGRAGLLEERFVFVDETSMCDTNLTAVLLSACPPGTHVLFIGDPHQLPPVGHGSPLRDLIAAGLPCGELTQVRRNAGQIVHACLRIKNGESFETADRIDLDAEPPRNLRHIPAKDEDDAAEVLELLLSKMTAFNPVWNAQVIVARNKGGKLTRKPLNDRLQALLNPDGKQVPGNPFRVGDKVIGLKNCRQHAVELIGESETEPTDYATLYSSDPWTRHREPREIYVANGEIGRVLAVGPKALIARFSEGEYAVRIHLGGKTADEKRGEDSPGSDEGRGCHFDLAYAVTCHKLQGSEAPCVIVMADPQGGGVCTREWLYTAVSRAAKVCILIGKMGVIDKMRLRVSTTRRKTFLTELLTEGGFNATNG